MSMLEPVNPKRREIGMLLTVVARLLRQDFDRNISDVGVTRSQWSMIAVVARRPGATQRQIAEIMQMSEASAGRLVDRLCADGVLVRRERDGDRRARCVELTEDAAPLLEKLGRIARDSEERVFAGFGDEELAALSTLLGKLYHNIAGSDPEPWQQ